MIGLDVRHGCASVPCLDCVTGLDVKHGFQLAVFRLCVWDRWWNRLWRAFLLVACVIGLDVRHGCASVPCLDYVTGLDVGNGSSERFCWCFWEHSLISIILCIFMEIFL